MSDTNSLLRRLLEQQERYTSVLLEKFTALETRVLFLEERMYDKEMSSAKVCEPLSVPVSVCLIVSRKQEISTPFAEHMTSNAAKTNVTSPATNLDLVRSTDHSPISAFRNILPWSVPLVCSGMALVIPIFGVWLMIIFGGRVVMQKIWKPGLGVI